MALDNSGKNLPFELYLVSFVLHLEMVLLIVPCHVRLPEGIPVLGCDAGGNFVWKSCRV